MGSCLTLPVFVQAEQATLTVLDGDACGTTPAQELIVECTPDGAGIVSPVHSLAVHSYGAAGRTGFLLQSNRPVHVRMYSALPAHTPSTMPLKQLVDVRRDLVPRHIQLFRGKQVRCRLQFYPGGPLHYMIATYR